MLPDNIAVIHQTTAVSDRTMGIRLTATYSERLLGTGRSQSLVYVGLTVAILVAKSPAGILITEIAS